MLNGSQREWDVHMYGEDSLWPFLSKINIQNTINAQNRWEGMRESEWKEALKEMFSIVHVSVDWCFYCLFLGAEIVIIYSA